MVRHSVAENATAKNSMQQYSTAQTAQQHGTVSVTSSYRHLNPYTAMYTVQFLQ
jgi:hypothetical protein